MNKDIQLEEAKQPSRVKELLNRHGFGDKYLTKLKKIDKIERCQDKFNSYAAAQLNDISAEIISMTLSFKSTLECIDRQVKPSFC